MRSLEHLSSDRDSAVVIILDTAAFIAALPLSIYSYRVYTVPKVVEEVRDSESVARLEMAMDLGRVEVVQPSPSFISKAVEIAKRLKLIDKLSETDIHVVALAIEFKERGLKPMVFTDDYDIQHILKFIGVEFRSVKTVGIKR